MALDLDAIRTAIAAIPTITPAAPVDLTPLTARVEAVETVVTELVTKLATPPA